MEQSQNQPVDPTTLRKCTVEQFIPANSLTGDPEFRNKLPGTGYFNPKGSKECENLQLNKDNDGESLYPDSNQGSSGGIFDLYRGNLPTLTGCCKVQQEGKDRVYNFIEVMKRDDPDKTTGKCFTWEARDTTSMGKFCGSGNADSDDDPFGCKNRLQSNKCDDDFDCDAPQGCWDCGAEPGRGPVGGKGKYGDVWACGNDKGYACGMLNPDVPPEVRSKECGDPEQPEVCEDGQKCFPCSGLLCLTGDNPDFQGNVGGDNQNQKICDCNTDPVFHNTRYARGRTTITWDLPTE